VVHLVKHYLVDLAWNHKGARYEKRSTERVSASSVATAARAAIAGTKKKHPGSIRETAGARFYITITVIGREE
jgi:hypothetical protein